MKNKRILEKLDLVNTLLEYLGNPKLEIHNRGANTFSIVEVNGVVVQKVLTQVEVNSFLVGMLYILNLNE